MDKQQNLEIALFTIGNLIIICCVILGVRMLQFKEVYEGTQNNLDNQSDETKEFLIKLLVK